MTPVSPAIVTPVSKVITTPYSTQIVTTNVVTPFVSVYDYDTGLNTSYIAQKEMTEYLLYRILDKWLYSDEMCHILKYLKINGNKVSYIANEDEYKNNKICNDSEDDVQKKADFIQENILGMKEMKNLLKRIIDELGYKWYELSSKEKLVVEVTEKFLRKRLKERVGTTN